MAIVGVRLKFRSDPSSPGTPTSLSAVRSAFNINHRARRRVAVHRGGEGEDGWGGGLCTEGLQVLRLRCAKIENLSRD